MVYETETERGITITIKPHRKSRGMKGCGRAGHSGKKAIIAQEGTESVTLYGDTFKEVSHAVRIHLNLPPHVTIKKDVTKL